MMILKFDKWRADKNWAHFYNSKSYEKTSLLLKENPFSDFFLLISLYNFQRYMYVSQFNSNYVHPNL